MLKSMRALSRIFLRQYSVKVSPQLASALAAEGIPDQTVANLMNSNPLLADYEVKTWQKTLDLFKNQGFQMEAILRILNKHPKIMVLPEAQVADNLEFWRASQIGERYVQILMTEHPHLLDLKGKTKQTEKTIMERLLFLKEYAQTKKNVWLLLVNSPNVINDPLAEIKAKIQYFTKEMKLEHTEVVKTAAFSHSLEHIKMRHEFLVRLGMFKPKNPKADPTIKSNNPSLYQIIDTNDKRFATKVALVSLEEYEVFQELLPLENSKTNSHRDEEEEFSDEEHP